MSEEKKWQEPYTGLGKVWRQAGFNIDAEQIAPRILDLAYHYDWIGRHIVDLACGIADVGIWFAQESYRVWAVDNSPVMLEQARRRAEKAGASHAITWVEQDMRSFELGGTVDLVMCLGRSLNYILSPRELEMVFHRVHRYLDEDKMFIFDLYTIQGLAATLGNQKSVEYDNGEDLFVMRSVKFNWENLNSTQDYTIFYREAEQWTRFDERHMLRAYPIQAVVALLDRVGFGLRAVLTPSFEVLEPNDDIGNSVYFVTTKKMILRSPI